jgi:FkbM family methyltransferase
MLRAARNALGRFPALHRALRSVWTPPESVYQHLHFQGPFTVEVESGVRFRMHAHGEQIENDLFWRGYGDGWEGNSLQIWRDLARSADYIADVGANTGLFALAAQAVNPSARVIALEPSARVFRKLQHNIALNGFPIIALDNAASDKNASATFFDHAGPHQYSASLEKSMGGQLASEVQVRRLDDLLAENGFERLDLLKLDVERHEPAALRGLRNTLERCRPTMLVEILDDELEAEIRHVLDGLDYEVSPIGADGPDPAGDARNFLVRPK